MPAIPTIRSHFPAEVCGAAQTRPHSRDARDDRDGIRGTLECSTPDAVRPRPRTKVQPRKFTARRPVERSQVAYLLWVRGTRGPYPQLVFSDPGEPADYRPQRPKLALIHPEASPRLEGQIFGSQLAAVFPLMK